ncbi:MAG: arylsulfatase [Fuerstiella sp.]
MRKAQAMRWSKSAVALSFCCGGLLIHPQKGLAGEEPAAHPNILLILADDLGYGDVSCYNADARVSTPHLDRLATQGMRFMDAHSPSTVCTPSRYSLLTGRMCFRTGYRGVFSGVGGPALIESNRLTLPQMLRNNGYQTACIGKWHLGLTFQTSDGSPAYAANVPKVQPRDWRDGGAALERVRRVDFSKPILDGPIHRGFDQFFGTACCPTTDWLYAWIEQDRVPVPPKQQLSHDGLPQHAYSYDNRRGLIAADFDLETVDPHLLKKSQQFLRQHVKQRPGQPFFLFHSMQAVHLPSFAAEQYKGRSKAGPHGDFLLEMDDIVGQLLQTLDELNIADNTLVIFTSDNGPEVTTVVNMRKDHKHDGAAPWRGMKRDQWEGGHRVPLIVRWPKRIPAGTVSNQLVNLTDFMATCAAIVDAPLPEDAAEDSFNLLPALLEADAPPVRKWMLSQTISLALAIREGQWKLLDHTGSGGNNYQRPPLDQYRLPDTAPEAPMQLYDLESDPGETTNLYHRHPDVVQRLKSKLDELRRTGRSAPSPTVTP